MPSITSRSEPWPKLRVTGRTCSFLLPQKAQISDEIDGDEDERASEADLDDSFRFPAVDDRAVDDVLDLFRVGIALAFDDLTREDDAFEVEDREVVICEFFSGVVRNDIVLGSNELPEVG